MFWCTAGRPKRSNNVDDPHVIAEVGDPWVTCDVTRGIKEVDEEEDEVDGCHQTGRPDERLILLYKEAVLH